MAAGSTYTPIATTTLSSTATSVTFSSLGSYTDIIAIITASAASPDDIRFRFNGDTGSNYSWTTLYGTGSAAGSFRQSSTSSGAADYYGSPSTVSGATIQTIHFMNYANSTTYKTAIARGNRSDSGADSTVSLWRNTSAITSIQFGIGTSFSNTIAVGSTFTLYGIAAA